MSFLQKLKALISIRLRSNCVKFRPILSPSWRPDLRPVTDNSAIVALQTVVNASALRTPYQQSVTGWRPRLLLSAIGKEEGASGGASTALG
jgi:hypothetical protein